MFGWQIRLCVFDQQSAQRSFKLGKIDRGARWQRATRLALSLFALFRVSSPEFIYKCVQQRGYILARTSLEITYLLRTHCPSSKGGSRRPRRAVWLGNRKIYCCQLNQSGAMCEAHHPPVKTTRLYLAIGTRRRRERQCITLMEDYRWYGRSAPERGV